MTTLTRGYIDKAYRSHAQQWRLSHLLREQEKGEGLKNDTGKASMLGAKEKPREQSSFTYHFLESGSSFHKGQLSFIIIPW